MDPETIGGAGGHKISWPRRRLRRIKISDGYRVIDPAADRRGIQIQERWGSHVEVDTPMDDLGSHFISYR